MLNFLLRIGFFLAIWKFLSPRKNGLLATGFIIALLAFLSGEAMNFLSATERDEFIGLVFFAKWSLWVLAVSGYYICVERPIKRARPAFVEKSGATDYGFVRTPKEEQHMVELKKKDTLRRRSDMIIERYKNDEQN